MQLRLLFSKWTQIAGLLLMAGALAWALKLGVIISTNGQIIDTGAAALLMKIGLFSLFVGSTGIGNRLSHSWPAALRVVAIVISPLLVFGSIFLLGMLTGPLFRNSSVWYAQQEAGIGVAAIVYLTAGFFLYRSYKSVPQ